MQSLGSVAGNDVNQDLTLRQAYYLTEANLMLLKMASGLAALVTVLTVCSYGQATSVRSDDFPSTPALNNKVAQFDVTDAAIIDALSKLSDESIPGLHLGIEEIIRDKTSEPTDRSVRFSLHLHDVTVRDILETLCKSDRRYMWSVDGSTVNLYPRETVGNSSYLLNRELDSIALKNMSRPSDVLTSLMKLLPDEQLGVAGIGIGIDIAYPQPWSAVFRHLTVRQLMNRVSEHSSPRGGWIWSGSTGQRFFAYFEHGFKQWRTIAAAKSR
jgi:hypothetical protein